MTAPHRYATRYTAAGAPATVRQEVARWSADPAVARLVVDRLPSGRVRATAQTRATPAGLVVDWRRLGLPAAVVVGAGGAVAFVYFFWRQLLAVVILSAVVHALASRIRRPR